jgi:DNA-binding NtrC family response regulator
VTSIPHGGTSPRPTLSLVRGGRVVDARGNAVVVGREPVLIGRGAQNDVVIVDAEVSAVHCELRATSQGVRVRDLGSTNGTFVNGLRIVEALLGDACSIRVGATLLRFEPSSSPLPSYPPAAESSFGQLVGQSPPMRQLYRVLRQVAPTELSVLISGETGTGKELVARAIHDASRRARGPLAVLDCGALPSGLAESLLFGHEKGAFTGATQRTDGVFGEANGGSVFLDELGELPVDLQPRLLRAIAERAVKRVGQSSYQPIDVRVVAATRRDLRRDVNAGSFREDLYFRIAQVRIDLPPLRERTEDIPLLIARACDALGRSERTARVSSYVASRFPNYDWPGNVRELVNVASVLAALGDGAVDDVLPLEAAPSQATSPQQFVQAKRAFEERYFRLLLSATGGNISEVARRCGLARHQVRAHLRKLGLM